MSDNLAVFKRFRDAGFVTGSGYGTNSVYRGDILVASIPASDEKPPLIYETPFSRRAKEIAGDAPYVFVAAGSWK